MKMMDNERRLTSIDPIESHRKDTPLLLPYQSLVSISRLCQLLGHSPKTEFPSFDQLESRTRTYRRSALIHRSHTSTVTTLIYDTTKSYLRSLLQKCHALCYLRWWQAQCLGYRWKVQGQALEEVAVGQLEVRQEQAVVEKEDREVAGVTQPTLTLNG